MAKAYAYLGSGACQVLHPAAQKASEYGTHAQNKASEYGTTAQNKASDYGTHAQNQGSAAAQATGEQATTLWQKAKDTTAAAADSATGYAKQVTG